MPTLRTARIAASLAILSLIASYPAHPAAAGGHTDPDDFAAAIAGLTNLTNITNVADFDGFSPGTLLASGTTSQRITLSYSLDSETLIVTDDYDTESPDNSLGLTGGDNALLDRDSLTLDFPAPVLAVGLFIVTSDVADAGEILLTGSFGTVSNTGTPLAVLADGGNLYFLGYTANLAFSSATLDFVDDGEVNFVYNVDEITTSLAAESVWTFSGSAAGGLTIDFTVDGVMLQIMTFAGQTGAQVAQAVADAINADNDLQNAGIFAEANGSSISTNGEVTDTVINDPGISHFSGTVTLFWTTDPGVGGGKIQRGQPGGAVQDLVNVVDPINIAVDLAAGKMYWTDEGSDKIQRANLDGSNVEDVLSQGSEVSGLAIDLDAGKIYFTIRNAGEIARADVDGSNQEPLVTTLQAPLSVALDPDAGKMYWSESQSGQTGIQRANLDGTSVENVVSTAVFPNGVALDLFAGKIYWALSAGIGSSKIQRANLDGSGVEDVVDGLSAPQAITVFGGKLYWADRLTAKIQRSNLDGSSVEDLVTGLDNPKGISVLASEVLPDCSDGVDNDGDGFIDFPDDPGCIALLAFQEDPECDDGIENDTDGLIDFPADPGCYARWWDFENPECSDGIENDTDGKIDFPADPGCRGSWSDVENPQCDDGINNDPVQDSLTDLADPECETSWDESEACGLGFELLLVILPALILQGRRGRRARR